MKILQLCKKLPFPLDDGEAIGVNDLTNLFLELGHEITLLSFNTTKHFTELDESTREELSKYESYKLIPLDTNLSPLDLLKSAWSKEGVLSRFDSSEMRRELVYHLQNYEYDMVLLESTFLMGYIDDVRKYSDAKVILRSHNVEDRIWSRVADNHSKYSVQRAYYRRYAQVLHKLEMEVPHVSDAIITVSDLDTEFYQKENPDTPAITVPLSINAEWHQQIKNSENPFPEMSFIGSLDWRPNIEGLTHFILHILPKIKSRIPDFKLHIAGKNASPGLEELFQNEGIVYHGYVKSSTDFILDYDAALVPLYSGSGIRIKILQSFSLGRAVISTPIGIEGIHATPDRDYLVARTDEEMVDQIEKLFSEKGLIPKLSESGLQFIEEHHSRDMLRNRLKQFLLRL